MLTIFTAPKPFQGHINVIQRNAIGSWLQLDRDVQVLLVGDETGMQAIAEGLNVQHLSEVDRNELGTPLVSSIFKWAEEVARFSTMCYVNADIILLEDFLRTVDVVDERFQKYLIIGQRWDLDIKSQLVFDLEWKDKLKHELEASGRLHPPAGSDYFVYKRGSFSHMPEFALGRAGWDNWMIYAGRAAGMPVVDATGVCTVIHQDHDYAHLPDGEPHYRLPESDENIRLAGGQETIFSLPDASWTFEKGILQRKSGRDRWNLREMEASAISAFGPGVISRLCRMLFHPKDTLRYYLDAVMRRVKRTSYESSGIRRELE